MKRDIYYSNVSMYHDQRATDRILAQLQSSFSTPLLSMSVLTASKGLVYGSVGWRKVSGSLDGSGPHMVDIDLFPADHFAAILVIEKESIFQEIISSGIDSALKCLILSAKGYPDVGTRSFLKRVSSFGRAPIFVLYVNAAFHCFKQFLTLDNLGRTPTLMVSTFFFVTGVVPNPTCLRRWTTVIGLVC